MIFFFFFLGGGLFVSNPLCNILILAKYYWEIIGGKKVKISHKNITET